MNKEYKSEEVGQEISCVMEGIDNSLLNDNESLKNILLDSLKKEGFGILDVSCHEFEPQGFTMMVLLSESHLAIHTYPEHNSIYFNMYSCRGPKDSIATFKNFRKALNPSKILYHKDEKVRVGA